MYELDKNMTFLGDICFAKKILVKVQSSCLHVACVCMCKWLRSVTLAPQQPTERLIISIARLFQFALCKW